MLLLFSLFFLEKCPICLDHITGPRRLKCRHVFCSMCLQQALKVNNRCPVCQEPQGVLRGNQPRGEMTSYHESFRSLPGYPGNFKTLLQTIHWRHQGPTENTTVLLVAQRSSKSNRPKNQQQQQRQLCIGVTLLVHFIAVTCKKIIFLCPKLDIVKRAEFQENVPSVDLFIESEWSP